MSETTASINTITINGVNYVQADAIATRPAGTRAVVVIDKGWIYAGDVVRENGRIVIHNALWIFRWESIGFDGVIANPKSPKVTIKPMPYPIDLPEGSEIYSVPVPADWGK